MTGFGRPMVLALLVACHTVAAASPTDTSTPTQPSAVSSGSTVAVRPPAGPAKPASAASSTVANLAHWVVATRDNGAMPFVIIDKEHAEVSVFDAAGHFQAAAPALLGLARGDRSVEGVGDTKMSEIPPRDRITPAGRFVASLSRDAHGSEILWVDYKDAIALHPVVKGTPKERRAERLASPTAADNRISYGCINVPLTFYRRFIRSAFAHTSGLVYILPETSRGRALFGPYKIGTGSTSPTPDHSYGSGP